MNAQTVKEDPIVQSLELWHQSIRTNNIEEADRLHNEIKRTIIQKRDPDTESYYQLYKSRYLILKGDMSAAHVELQQIKNVYWIGDELRGFYFHFFSGILSTNLGEYEQAEASFIQAYRLLNYVSEGAVRADFFYKASILYYHIRLPLTALNYANDALKGLNEYPGYEVITADCENLLGLCCTSLRQYAKGEEHFLTALDMAKKVDHQKLSLLIKYNLGYLYAEQNISDLAIRYLLEVYEQEEPYYKTIYLLAREHYKVNDLEKAEYFVKKGIECTNEEYKHHFHIVKALNSGVDDNELEVIVTDGIHFFEKHELFGFVEDYSGELAQYFHQKANHQKANHYFHKAFLAKQNLQKKEALK
jgi:response regulator aspartate phosphatase C